MLPVAAETVTATAATAKRRNGPNPTETADAAAGLDAAELRAEVIAWFADAGRDLPWRHSECSPWGVLVSEVMLQQTPVKRVLPHWEEWMQRWPTPADLAAEPSGEAVRAWSGLGYPRRALRLHACAQEIVEVHGGKVPADHEELRALPGIGEYTAAAVASFAFGIPATVVDTNIRRVEARAVTGNALPEKSYTRAEAVLAHDLMPNTTTIQGIDEANRWNAASMELGALVCKARTPLCEQCPVQHRCAWIKAGRPAPHYTPKGQAWEGTDRQVRGAMMAVLRGAEAPVAAELLRGVGHVETDIAELAALRHLKADAEQRERCLAGLLKDGLAAQTDAGVTLPA